LQRGKYKVYSLAWFLDVLKIKKAATVNEIKSRKVFACCWGSFLCSSADYLQSPSLSIFS